MSDTLMSPLSAPSSLGLEAEPHILGRPAYDQRWRDRLVHLRVDDGSLFDPRLHSVDVISDRLAKPFVMQHHYSSSFGASRLNVGLFCSRGPGADLFRRLVGVCSFSVPMNPKAAFRYTGQADAGIVDLGRLVLLDEVPFNAESWFVSRALSLLRQEKSDVRFVLSYADPVQRRAADGSVLMPGHIGTVYQALSAAYAGRATARTLILSRDGTVLSDRTLSKIRQQDRGADYAERLVTEAGASPRRPGEEPSAWLQRVLPAFQRLRHPGNLAYVFALTRSGRRLLRQRYPYSGYPKGDIRIAA